ncbi:MAG: hypothetical protein WC378_11390, partial [Opitutaceae bacterium]
MNNVLTKEQEARLRHVINLSNAHGNKCMHFDLSDPTEAGFLKDCASRSGMTPERYPHHAKVMQLKPAYSLATRTEISSAPNPNLGDFVPNQLIDYIGQHSDGLTIGQATLTRTSPIASATLWLNIVNVNGQTTTVLASGQAMTFNKQTITLETDHDGALPLPTTGTNSGLISWTITYTDGTTENSYLNSQWAYQTTADPTVIDPAQRQGRTTGDLKSIVIGLARAVSAADIDYWFWQGQWENTTLLVPLSGSMTFKYPIAQLGSNNPSLEFYLAKKEGGMSDLKVDKTRPYLKYFSLDPKDPKKINFKIPATDAAAINFGKSLWASDTKTYFTCRVTVVFQDPSKGIGWSSIVCSDKPDMDPTDGVAFIKPIVYVWHCLVAGTQITLADGTTKAIETMDSG